MKLITYNDISPQFYTLFRSLPYFVNRSAFFPRLSTHKQQVSTFHPLFSHFHTFSHSTSHPFHTFLHYTSVKLVWHLPFTIKTLFTTAHTSTTSQTFQPSTYFSFNLPCSIRISPKYIPHLVIPLSRLHILSHISFNLPRLHTFPTVTTLCHTFCSLRHAFSTSTKPFKTPHNIFATPTHNFILSSALFSKISKLGVGNDWGGEGRGGELRARHRSCSVRIRLWIIYTNSGQNEQKKTHWKNASDGQ